jgi:molecular chaperone GrpE
MTKKFSKKDIDDLKKELEKAKKKAEENLAGWKRALADYANFRKREEENKKELIKYANENLILEILPVLDNFQSAYKNLPKDLEKNNWVEGIKYVKSQFESLLKNMGIEEIKTAGEKFNPELHEAVEKVKIDDKKPDIVMSEVLKGYRLGGKIIRAAKVRISG